MAKIWGIPHNRRAKKFKGFVRIQAMKGGGYQAASWPRKGQYDKSPAGYERSRLFGLIQHWTSRPLWWEQLDALNLSVGTPYLPRDILTKSAYGTLTYLKFKDGTMMFPAKVMSQEIQAQLNTISTTPGAMLVRTAAEWVALDPGPADTVLTAHGAAALPTWSAPAGGAGGGWYGYSVDPLIWSTRTEMCLLNGLIPLTDVTVSGITGCVQFGGDRTLAAVLLRMNGTTVAEVVDIGPSITQHIGNYSGYYLPLTDRRTLTAGNSYLLGTMQISPTPPQTLGKLVSSSMAPTGPFRPGDQQNGSLNKVPEVGDTVNVLTGAAYWHNIRA